MTKQKNAKINCQFLSGNKYSVLAQAKNGIFAYMNLLAQNKKREKLVQYTLIYDGTDEATHIKPLLLSLRITFPIMPAGSVFRQCNPAGSFGQHRVINNKGFSLVKICKRGDTAHGLAEKNVKIRAEDWFSLIL